jgi:hypothetical protein
VRTHHGLHDSPDGARRLHGETPGNKLLILLLLDDMVASGDVEELHGPDGEGALALDGLEEAVGGGAVVRRVECVDLLLVDDAGGGHVHEGVSDQVPEIAQSWAVGHRVFLATRVARTRPPGLIGGVQQRRKAEKSLRNCAAYASRTCDSEAHELLLM